MNRTVDVYFLRTFISSKEMHAKNQLMRDVWDEMAIFELKKRCPLRKCMKTMGFCMFSSSRDASGHLGRHREPKFFLLIFFLFSMCLGRLRQAAFEPNFMAQLRTRARFPRSTLEIHWFFSSEMKTGKQMCRAVCVFLLKKSIIIAFLLQIKNIAFQNGPEKASRDNEKQ